MLTLLPAEQSYLYDGLCSTPPVRPDLREAYQFRPLEAKTDFLPLLNGLARIRAVDGLECIVLVKLKVEPLLDLFIEVAVDVAGYRDDLNFVLNLQYSLTLLLTANFPRDRLVLTKKYMFKLYVDCVVISHTLYPLSLMNLAIYLALKSTRLPLLISSTDDDEIAELPTFSDDWDLARPIADDLSPPLYVVVGVVGTNLVFDPLSQEEQVLENGLVLSYYNGNVITPITNVNLLSQSSLAKFKGVLAATVAKGIAMVSQYCGEIVSALDALVLSDDSTSIF